MLSNFRNVILVVIVVVFLLTFGCLSCYQFSWSIAPEEYMQQAVEEINAKDLEHGVNWRLGEEVNWVADQDNGKVIFMFADGTSASAPMQIVGTYNIADETFRWGWEHPIVAEPLREHAKLALRFGQDNQLPNFTQPIVSCTREEAWAFTATAAKLGNANGAYSGPTGNTRLLITFGEVSLSQ